MISVIVPVYNGETYLESCIDSIENQTYRNLEIIIINDGSTDKTDRVCARLQENYDNIKVISMNDEGVSAARNVGIEAAEGEFITFVDADDRLKPDMLQMLYDCITETESDIAGCRFFIWKDESEWKKFSDAAPMTQILSEGQEGKRPIKGHKIYKNDTYVRNALLQGNSRCWSKLYRRSAVGGVRFRKGLSIGEDMLFLMDLLPFVKKIAETQYPGYGYFQNPDGAMGREFTPAYMDQITCWEIAREKISDMDPDEDLFAQVTAILIMGIMLTVGKIAALPTSRRCKQQKYIQICHEKLKGAMSMPGAYQRLSVGYKIKAGLFRYLPKSYLMLYHLKKAGRNSKRD